VLIPRTIIALKTVIRKMDSPALRHIDNYHYLLTGYDN
jgi:hypothetical protein